MLDRLEALAPRARWLVPLIALLAWWPSLLMPFMVDDWIFLAMVEEDEVFPPRGPTEFFHLDLDGETFPGGVQGNAFWWWSDPGFRANFFRPISSLTHALDFAVFGRWAPGHHAVSLALYLALVAVAGALYRKTTTPLVALLAALIFAVDDAHAWPIAWLANRNALLAVLGASGLLYGHHRWRSGGGVRWLGLSLASYVFGLCSAEAALAASGYVLAYELCVGDEPLLKRLPKAIPAVGTGLLYLVFWRAGDFGTAESGMYINPFHEPVQYLSYAVPTRVPLLLMSALLPVSVDMSFLLTEPQLWASAALSAGLAAWLLWAMRGTLARDPMARMFLLGSLGALLPIAATMAASRNLLLPTLGFAYVLARVIADGLRGDGPRWLAKLMIACHLILAPLGAWLGVGMLNIFGDVMNDEMRALDIPSEGVEDLRVAVLNSQSPMTGLYMRVLHSVDKKEMPAAIWPLVTAPADQEVVRTGVNSLRLRAAHPGYLATPFEQLTRNGHAVEPGQIWTSGGLRIEAVEVEEGRLLAFEASFDRGLDSDDLLLLAWDGERYSAWEPPEIGACKVLPLLVNMPMVGAMRRPPPADACDRGGPPLAVTPSPRPVATPSASPQPSAVAEAPCTLDLLTPDGWTRRAELDCPGEDGLGIVALGDVGAPGKLLSATTRQMAARCAAEPCHLMTLAGDLMYIPGDQAAQAWPFIWDATLATLELPGIGVLGNHEYRHEPNPEGKRAALYAADGQRGFVLPGPSWTMRVARGGEAIFALAGLDTDSVANPGPDMPGLGEAALTAACALDVPTIVVGHHPSSSQGLHHNHEDHVEAAMAKTLREASAGGCEITAYLAGHDHDLQAWPPGCEREGDVGTVVSGVSARGFRKPGSEHLSPCPASGADGSYHGALSGGGFAIVRVGADAAVDARLYHVPAPGEHALLSSQRW